MKITSDNFEKHSPKIPKIITFNHIIFFIYKLRSISIKYYTYIILIMALISSLRSGPLKF